MNNKQNISTLPMLKQKGYYSRKIPIIQAIQSVHRHNIHVAEVCQEVQRHTLENYYQKKEKFDKEIEPTIERRILASKKIEETLKKSIEERNRSAKKKNEENLQKLQRYLTDKKQKVAQKQLKMMANSLILKQKYLTKISSSIHCSRDCREYIKSRHQFEKEESLNLLNKSNEKIMYANQRKSENIEKNQEDLRQKNEYVMANIKEIGNERHQEKENEQLKKIVKKYSNIERFMTNRDKLVQKQIENKRKQQFKRVERNKKKKEELLQKDQKQKQGQLRKDNVKLFKATFFRQRKLQNMIQSIQLKRRQKSKMLENNTFYINQEKTQKRQEIVHKHHSSQIFLTSIKNQLQDLQKQNFQENIRMGMKS